MSSAPDRHPPDQFRRRFAARDLLVGSFVKTPSVHATEIFGDIGYDFVVVDEEHAPFDRGSTELVLMAARAAGTAAIVRVSDPSASRLLAVLDDGATGVLVPHVSSAAEAREVAMACRYRGGKRGFSNSPRAGRYWRTPAMGARRRPGCLGLRHRHDRRSRSAR